MEDIRWMWKTRGCNAGPCPALMAGPMNGQRGYYVQHKRVTDPEIRARLLELSAANGNPLAADEEYGWVNADVIDRVREPA